jgi:hypothetical protein
MERAHGRHQADGIARREAEREGPAAKVGNGSENLHQGLLTLLGWMALCAEIRPDEAEPEYCGGSTVEGENEVWPDFRHNPEGRGRFSPFRRRSSLQ